jgi:hypothetical protein
MLLKARGTMSFLVSSRQGTRIGSTLRQVSANKTILGPSGR